MVNVWTLLWQSEDRKPFVYSTLPKKKPLPDEPESRFYTPEDVIKFERMLSKHLTDYKFRCLDLVTVYAEELQI